LKYSSITAVTGSSEEGISLVVAFSKEDGDAPLSRSCLSTNTMFTLMESGVGVAVAGGVKVEVNDGVKVGVWVAVIVGVSDFVAAGTLVCVGAEVDVGGFVDVADGVVPAKALTTRVGVEDEVIIGV
jgi:hypothetical protein